MNPTKTGYYVRRDNTEIWREATGVLIERLFERHTEGHWWQHREYAIIHDNVMWINSRGHRRLTPSGIRIDGGSIPKPFWFPFGNPWGDYLLAYIIHDGDCKRIDRILESGAVPIDQVRRMRRLADKDFLEGLRWINRKLQTGGRIERLKLRIKYRAVRLEARRRISR